MRCFPHVFRCRDGGEGGLPGRMHLRQVLSIRGIARRTGLSRNTVARHLAANTVEPGFATPERSRKPDPFAGKPAGRLKTGAGKAHAEATSQDASVAPAPGCGAAPWPPPVASPAMALPGRVRPSTPSPETSGAPPAPRRMTPRSGRGKIAAWASRKRVPGVSRRKRRRRSGPGRYGPADRGRFHRVCRPSGGM